MTSVTNPTAAAPGCLCGTAEAKAYLRRGALVLLQCRRCAQVYLRRDPVDTNQGNYESVYTELRTVSSLTTDRYSAILRTLSGTRRRNRLIEIGCGAGAFLRQARDEGWDVIGTETAATSARQLLAAGLDVRQSDLAALDLPDAGFDCAVMLEVIEHLADPAGLVREVARILRPGGQLILSTPNIASLSRHLIGNRWRIIADEHLWYFSPRTLRTLLSSVGFTVVSLESRNFYPPDVWRAFRARAQGRPAGDLDYGAQTTSALRQFTAERLTGRLMKGLANAALRVTSLGDTLWVQCSRG